MLNRVYSDVHEPEYSTVFPRIETMKSCFFPVPKTRYFNKWGFKQDQVFTYCTYVYCSHYYIVIYALYCLLVTNTSMYNFIPKFSWTIHTLLNFYTCIIIMYTVQYIHIYYCKYISIFILCRYLYIFLTWSYAKFFSFSYKNQQE